MTIVVKFVVETEEIRDAVGGNRLLRGTTCCVCHKPIRPKSRYRVRTRIAAYMAAPSFYYSHIRCKEQPR